MHLGPYEELIASFNGNVVKIRLPKSTKKPMKLTPSKEALQKLCTCGEGEPVCEATCGRGTDLADDPTADQLNLQIPDDMCAAYDQRTMLNSELVYGQKPGQNPICNVTPSNAPPGVKACKIPCADKDVFVLKIGKTSDEPQRTLPIEVHLATPKRPGKPKPPLRDCKTIQCEEVPCCPPCPRGPCVSTPCGSCGPCGPCGPCGRCFSCAPCPPPGPCPRGPCCSPCPPPPRAPRRRRTPCLPCCK